MVNLNKFNYKNLQFFIEIRKKFKKKLLIYLHCKKNCKFCKFLNSVPNFSEFKFKFAFFIVKFKLFLY